MKKEIKLLCMSFWTPPVIRPQAILIGKMIPEWKRLGINPVILTYEECQGWNIKVPVYHIPRLKLGLFQSYFFKDKAVNEYYEGIFAQAEEIIKKHDIELVFSFSNPQDSNLLGAMLKKKLRIKFISHFSDPFSRHPYRRFLGFRNRKKFKIEEYILRNSDRTVFVNESLRDYVMGQHPEISFPKTAVIPHCYDLKAYPDKIKTKKKRFIVSHIGAFYKERPPDPIFRIFRTFIEGLEVDSKRPILRLVGTGNKYSGFPPEKIIKLVRKSGIEEHTEIVPAVSYFESLKLMKMSDCLVLIDADIIPSPFLPSKLIDYLGSGKPVLAVTPNKSGTFYALKKAGVGSFAYDETADAVKYLKSIYFGEKTIKPNSSIIRSFDVRNTSRLYMKLFSSVSLLK
jgi:glycosyltransferase involved in cell wall biosynthesis